ncbi:bifunctional adenosylcobinamide kinase/adenosylcobinamide-phosphate guanylyltransferase [Flammeovirga kamogawensis]|uniref:Adenosylcobinamide kinase n=1 Tax=Flammeovirga kamogawensis TaxID=373891 RepID=A0ABX8H2V3_9BACT|nr:bifunctional adenosylcobinamide kinase/adenosylcobinamide-phosphate guanylyltransferase [Flammeovirga kamogawensis]MBB6460346.1 adenosylcobinamide kinase/adenosylcobinamide-phosphate guanylyltransferase [Flammeovirga kamogawensis]QWG10155.1 bifunctional adenosylcobinamide kinase/adenosylcobinamide-phosphate guanylyltransferase [Flammeovirga kamogawensis]TRX64607.1 bifunctional adenosylcobinamide kinase/adenosylcobinamide-phosphate guanylyltransferase [Flammeovirga kamogawensis]
MAKIHMITGGQRSGKSVYAEKIALSLSNTPYYLATSKKWDEEHTKRIDLHQKRRTNNWITIEEEIDLHLHQLKNKVILLDCVTLWLTNIFDKMNYDKEKTFDKAVAIWEQLILQDCTLIVVANEIGLGGISMHKGTRHFTDVHGLINQRIAKDAQQVTFIVAGLPLIVKG